MVDEDFMEVGDIVPLTNGQFLEKQTGRIFTIDEETGQTIFVEDEPDYFDDEDYDYDA